MRDLFNLLIQEGHEVLISIVNQGHEDHYRNEMNLNEMNEMIELKTKHNIKKQII